MSDDLEALGFSASGQDDEDDEDEEHMGGAVSYSHSSAQVSLAEDDSSNHKNSSANKRNAGEISEDEESANHSGRSPSMSMSSVASSQASSSKKTRRTTANPVASGSTLLAPKPTLSSSTSAPASPTTVTTTFGSKSTKAVASPAVTTSSDDPEAEMTISSTTTNIDTSTAHIKALTGSKGATMCFEHVAGTPRDQTVAIPNLATADTLSPEEKAKFSRDRNRLHARNTRIRKKAYVDELKRTLEVLVKERDAVVVAQKQKTQIEHEERQVRFSVMEEFLRLRGVNETNPERWCAILEDAVTLSLPNYKDYGNHATKKNSKTAAKAMVGGTAAKMNLSGVRDVMKECNDFCKLVVQQQQQQSSSPKKKGSARKPLQAAGGSVSFSCDRDSLLMEGCNVVLDWTSNFQDPSKNDSVRIYFVETCDGMALPIFLGTNLLTQSITFSFFYNFGCSLHPCVARSGQSSILSPTRSLPLTCSLTVARSSTPNKGSEAFHRISGTTC